MVGLAAVGAALAVWWAVPVPSLARLGPERRDRWSAWAAGVGVAWGAAANGLRATTVKAVVADLVPSARRATAYGVFAAIQGVAAVSGGALAGWLYQTSLPALVGVVAATQLAMALLLIFTLRWQRQHEAPC